MFGSSLIISARTDMPPIPESKIPIGKKLLLNFSLILIFKKTIETTDFTDATDCLISYLCNLKNLWFEMCLMVFLAFYFIHT